MQADPLPPPPPAPGGGPASSSAAAAEEEEEVDEDVSSLYRKTTAARALADALSDLSQQEGLTLTVLAGTMEAFDRAILRSTEEARHLACRARVEGELEAYHNVDERWRLVLRGPATVAMEANTPLEPDRTLTLGRGAALSLTCVDDQHAVQGASFRRKAGGKKRGAAAAAMGT